MINSTTRFFFVGAVIAAIVALFGVSSPAYAQPETPDRYVDTIEGMNPTPVENFQGRHPGLEDASGTVTVLVQLNGTSGADAYTAANVAGLSEAEASASLREAAEAALDVQAEVRTQLSSLEATELYSVQLAMNAMVMHIPADNIDALAALPGVASVAPAPIHTVMQNSSLPFHGVPDTWDATGQTGAGVSIGIIDTGIDYLHLGFGGSGDYTDQTDPTTLSDTPGAFPSAKVAGGYDFVGFDYDASSSDPALNTPMPDEDPTDCQSHGTHVAGTAAGYGVQSGATYTGPWDNTLNLDNFDVPPGVAPEAELWALKVFGCNGSTAVTILAVEYAMDPDGDFDTSDHLDVINLSLGGIYGNPGGLGEQAINAAAQIGVVPVIAAGNDGEAYFINGGPGVATRGISVAAIQDDSAGAATVDDGTQDSLAFPATYGPEWTSVTGAEIALPSGAPSEGCLPADFDGTVSGKVALVDRGSCNFTTKTENAQAAGASAVLITNVVDNTPFAPGSGPGYDDSSLTIPTAMISGTYGDYLKTELGGGVVTVDVDPAGFPLGNAIASFTSMGPVRPDYDTGEILLKPDIAAVGTNVTSVQTGYLDGPGDGSSVKGGTSMAAPHVAGMAAMMRAEHPTLSVAQLKAALMNTANGYDEPNTSLDLVTEALSETSVTRTGAGTANIGHALNINTTGCLIMYAQDNPGAISVSFDTVDVLPTTPDDTEAIMVENLCGSPVDITDVSFYLTSDTSGIDFSASISPTPGSPTNVGTGGTSFDVTAAYNRTAMLHERQDALVANQNGARHYIAEEGGFVVVTVDGTEPIEERTLILPVFSAARPASDMSIDSVTDQAAGVDINLDGDPLLNVAGTLPGALPESNIGLVTGFELLLTDREETPFTNDPWDSADIRHVGIANNGTGTAFVAVEMWDSWASTSLDSELYVCTDYDQDGTGGAFGNGVDWCWIVYGEVGTDNASVYLFDVNGYFGSPLAIYNAKQFQGLNPWLGNVNALPANLANTRVLNNSVMFLAIPYIANQFYGSLTTSGNDVSPDFDLYAYTSHFRSDDFPVDETPTVTYSPDRAVLNPAYDEGLAGALGLPAQVDGDGTSSAAIDFGAGPVPVDLGYFPFYHNDCDPSGETTALLLHHHNTEPARAETQDLTWIPDPADCPVIPGDAAVTLNGDYYAELSWSAPVNTDSISVDRRQAGSNQWLPLTTTASMTGYVDESAVCGSTYEYRVTLYNADGGFVDAVLLPFTLDCSGLFTDVPSDLPAGFMENWTYAMYQSGITQGCNAGTAGVDLEYCPSDSVIRGAMAVFIVRALGVTPADDPSDPFVDIGGLPPGFEEAIEYMYDQGITTGCNAGTPGVDLRYCPNDPVTRGAMAVFLLRALNITPVDDPSDPFGDIGGLPPGFEESIETFYDLGITQGCSQSPLQYCPNDPVTRGAMAVFILRAFDDIPDPEDTN